MRLRHLLFFITIIITVTSLSAQKNTWQFGARAGISIPNLKAADESANTIDAGYKSILAPFYGLQLQYNLNTRWSLVTEINYSSQGGQKLGDQKLSTSGFEAIFPVPPGSSLPPYLYAQFDNKVNINYIEVPLMVKYHFITHQKFNIAAQAGVYAGYLLYAHNVARGKGKLYLDANYSQLFFPNDIVFDNDQDIKEQLNTINLGIQGGGTFSYHLSKQLDIQFSGGGTYGLRRLQRDTKYGNNKTGALILSLGASYHF